MDRRDFMRLSAAGAFLGLGHTPAKPSTLSRTFLPTPDPATRGTRLVGVNTTSIRAAVELGCQSLGRVFNDHDAQVGAPYFWINLRPGVGLSFSDAFSDAQVPGKSLLGLLAAEKTLGVRIDPAVIDRFTRVALFSYGGPVPFPLNRDVVDGKLVNFLPVNIAHGFHALYALAAFRKSERAQELADASIAAVSRLWDPGRGWDRAHLEGVLGLTYRDVQVDAPFIAGLAMAIGPLAKYHQATGSRAALDLAAALKDKVIAEHFLPSGEYDPALLGAHVQNVVHVMASLAWLASITKDAPLMARVQAFYDNGLQRIRNAIGWSPEFFGSPARVGGPRGTNAERGEAGNSALILETALLLGESGSTRAFADAEVLLRSHLLPSQLRDVSFVAPHGSSQSDAAVAGRVRGAWGFPASYGLQPLGDRIVGVGTDITGPVIYALAEAHARAVKRQEDHLVIDLLLDHREEGLAVASAYSATALTVTVHTTQPVRMRIPPWVPANRVVVTGAVREADDHAGGYLRIPATTAGRFSVRFPLATREIDLSVGGRLLRARVRGDEVVAMDNHGTDLRFFASTGR